jgi:hypothetical protein
MLDKQHSSNIREAELRKYQANMYRHPDLQCSEPVGVAAYRPRAAAAHGRARNEFARISESVISLTMRGPCSLDNQKSTA